MSFPGGLWLRLYRLLLALYPATFRDRFGEEMVQDARRLLASAKSGRGRSALRLFRDVLRSLPAAWARELGLGAEPEGTGGRPSVRSGSRGGFVAGVREDLRWALRSLGRAPRFTGATVLVLALGLGVAVTVFSVADAYLLQGLPYPDSERLVGVRPVPPLAWHETGEVFDPAVSWDLDAFTLVDGDRPELVEGAWVAPGFFQAFGIRPALGRAFDLSDAGQGGGSVAVISHALWQQRYGGDPDVLGRTVSVFSSDRPDDAEVFEIVGVLPRDFWFHNRFTEFLAPLRADNPVYMGRLREGLPLEEAEDLLTEMALATSAELPAGYRVSLTPFHERYVAGVRPTLTAVSLGVGLVLLIALVNGALLLLVRTTGRQRELAIRRALGAGRLRVARQLVLEGLVLGVGAAVLGVGAAVWGLEALAGPLQAYLGTSVPGGAAALGLDGRGMLVAGGLVLGVALIFALVSLLAPVHRSLPRSLSEGGRGTGEARGHRRLRLAMVVGEVALSLALLIGAGLSIRSARHQATLELGFEATDRYTAQVNLRERSYPEARDRLELFRSLLASAGELPGVIRAAGVIRPPFGWNFNQGSPLEASGRPAPDPDRAPRGVGLLATPGYFETMGIPLLRGRSFEPEDVEGATPVTVVSESLAGALWPGEDPVGKRLREVLTPEARAHGQEEPQEWWTVVGVVGDTRLSLEDPGAQYYVSYGQITSTSISVVLHMRPGVSPPFVELERAIRALDPTVALDRERSLAELTRIARGPAEFLAGVLVGFAGFALALAVLGLFGVISYAASRARREVAVRIALGASRRHVVGLFLRTGLVTLALGLPAGLTGGWLLARSLADELHGVSATDPVTYGALTILLGASALLASWIPALRAARSEPMQVLRDE